MLRLPLALAALALTGCAAHVPMSETLLFHDPIAGASHIDAIGVGISGSRLLQPTDFLDAKAVARFDETDPDRMQVSEVTPLNPYGTTGALYASLYPGPEKNLAVSLSLGSMGADATIRLSQRNYLTMGYALGGNHQVIVQHRAFNTRFIGATLGLAYRRDRLPYDVETTSTRPRNPGEPESAGNFPRFDFQLGPDGSLPVTSFGPRATLLMRGDEKRGSIGGMRGIVYAGYAPHYRRWITSAGFSMGIF